MKPVDTHLSELEHLIRFLEETETKANKRVAAFEEQGRYARMHYWTGYSNAMDDILSTLRERRQWLKDHPL